MTEYLTRRISPRMALAPFVPVVSLAVLIFLAVLLIVDRHRPPGTRYLIALLVILGAIIGHRLAYDLQSGLVVYLPFLVFTAAVLYAPCIYLYSETTLFNRVPSFKLAVGLLSAPVLVLVVHAALQLRFAELRDAAAIGAQAGAVAWYSRSLFAVAALYNLGFLLITLNNLRRYRQSYRENFAAADMEQVRWLKLLVMLNLVLGGSVLIGSVVIAVFDWKIPQTPIEGLVALALIYIILYYFIKKPQIFSLPAATRHSAVKYQRQNLAEAERKAYIEKIERYLVEEKPFLDDKVTLAQLSRELGIPTHHFSMVINIERNTNFYHFINAYRVEEAKTLLLREDMRDETVLDIGLMAGFQSKAGFNKVFKEITGKTPSAFRERS